MQFNYMYKAWKA